MIGRAGWVTRATLGVFVLALVSGCGGSQPEPEPDMTDVTPPAPPQEEVVEPPRPEKPAWVDPNEQYASVLVPIHFEFNKYRIQESEKAKLEGIAGLMKNNGSFKMLIEGHCDERGTNEYNMALGEQRALSTKRYLVALGVAESRFTTISYGEERPLVMGQNEAAWAKNRRCQFRVEAPGS